MNNMLIKCKKTIEERALGIIPLDSIASAITGLGVSGLVLLSAIQANDLAGGASLTSALKSIGPKGMIGGIAALGVLSLIAFGISKYGYDAIFISVYNKIREKGETKDSLRKKVDRFPISKELKLRLYESFDKAENICI